LGLFYRLSDLAFIGGSLVPHGGQNPIEALNANVAILHGPHTTNFEDAYREIAKFDAGLKVEDGKSLGETVTRLLQTDIEISRLRTSGRDVLERMSGALDRTVTEILKFLPDERCAEPEGEPSDGDDVAETNLQRAS
jgi:3-deoxy-D-manno-octulosonic-acid transferase